MKLILRLFILLRNPILKSTYPEILFLTSNLFYLILPLLFWTYSSHCHTPIVTPLNFFRSQFSDLFNTIRSSRSFSHPLRALFLFPENEWINDFTRTALFSRKTSSILLACFCEYFLSWPFACILRMFHTDKYSSRTVVFYLKPVHISVVSSYNTSKSVPCFDCILRKIYLRSRWFNSI